MESSTGSVSTSAPSFPAGVRQVRLRLRQRQGDQGQSEDGGELHLRIPERSAGPGRVVPSTAAPDRGVRHGAEPDQGLEGPGPGRRSEVCERRSRFTLSGFYFFPPALRMIFEWLLRQRKMLLSYWLVLLALCSSGCVGHDPRTICSVASQVGGADSP